MKKLLLLLIIPFLSFGQEIVRNNNGENIILNPNGTWTHQIKPLSCSEVYCYSCTSGRAPDASICGARQNLITLDSIYQIEIYNIALLVDSLNKVDYSTQGMRMTSARTGDEYDKLLNKYYNLLKSKLPKEQFLALRDAQREWIKYRDDYVSYVSNLVSTTDGTMYTLYPGLSYVNIVEERVEFLYKLNRKANEQGCCDSLIRNNTVVEFWHLQY